MADPFDALREPVPQVRPDRAFAAQLRRRLEREIAAPPIDEETPSPVRTVTAYLAVDDARRALEWYAEVFGAQPVGDPIVMDDGRIGHAVLRLGSSELYLSDEAPALGVLGPRSRGGTTVSLVTTVESADAAVDHAVSAGAELERAVADQPYGRMGVVRDPFGHRWMVNASPAAASTRAGAADGEPGGRHGDLGYFTLSVPDAGRARAFYGDLLGWSFSPGSVEEGFQIGNVRPMGGLAGGSDRSSATLCYQVGDISAAIRRVRELGGKAEDAAHRPYGALAECTDDQGTRFQLWQPPGRS